MTDARKAYDELQQREYGTYRGDGAPEDVEYLRHCGATKPSESVQWTFPDGSRLQARRGRLYLTE